MEERPIIKKIIYKGQEYYDTPRIRELIKRADAINSSLPEVQKDHVRLWRGNRPNEVGQNPSFTNSLVLIALPFMDVYKGELSYIEIPRSELDKYVSKNGSAPDSEFILPTDIAAKAKVVEDTQRPTPIKQVTEYPERHESSADSGWKNIN